MGQESAEAELKVLPELMLELSAPEEFGDLVRFDKRLPFWFDAVRTENSPANYRSGQIFIIGERLAVSTSGPPDDEWVPFSPWGFPPSTAPLLYQKRGSVIALTGTSLDDQSAPQELDIHVSLGGNDLLPFSDGTSIELSGLNLTIDGPVRDHVVSVEGRHVLRLRTGHLVLDLGIEAKMAEIDPSAIPSEESLDLRHDYDIDPQVPQPGQEVVVKISAPKDADIRIHYGTEVAGDLHESAAALEKREEGEPPRFTGVIPGHPAGTTVRYRIESAGEPHPRFVGDGGPGFVFPDIELPFSRPAFERFSYRVGPHGIPEWARDAVIYHVLIDRFASHIGNLLPKEEVPWLGFAGGTIQGLTERLGYIADLGADVVWVSPFFRSQMHVGYDVEDFFSVHPRLGTLSDVRRLCDEAHRLGLRLLLDFEPSYIGTQHPHFLRARSHEDSPHRRWFHWHRWPDRPFGWFGSRMMAALDHSHPPVRAHLLDSARFWLDMGFDGFRLDSAHAAPLDFWTEFGRAVGEHSPDSFVVGEIMDTLKGCLRYRGRLQGFLDFETCNAIRGFAGTGETDAKELERVLAARATIPDDFISAGFIENHDLDRFTFLCPDKSDRRVHLALMLLIGSASVPVLYYGTEVGMGQDRPGDIDLTVRPPMVWGEEQNAGLLSFVRELLAWRKSHICLRRGTFHTISANGACAFIRKSASDAVLVAANASKTTSRFSVPSDLFEAGKDLKQVGNAKVEDGRGRLHITLPPLEGLLLSSTDRPA